MAVMTALAIAGLATSVYGQIRAGRAAKKAGQAERAAADSQAELQDYNASVAELQSTDALERGDEAANRYRMGVRGMIGSQRAGAAAGNIDVGVGSAVDVQADAAYLGELDALTLKSNATREAWGYKVQATDLTKRAQIARKEGVYLEKAGGERATSAYIGAAGTVLAGTGSLLESRYGFDRRRAS